MEQGRRAAYHACGEPVARHARRLQPIGIYTIPEISFVGRTEDELTDEHGPVRGRHLPLPRAGPRRRSSATPTACSSSWCTPETRQLLGVHVFGTGATELVHIGQTVMGCGGTVDYLVDAVFNYPTLAESYKVAALDAMNKMRAVARMSP